MKKILVTGGLGFIGFHLVQYLYERYDSPDITVIDNLSSSKIDFGTLISKIKVKIKDLLEVDDIDDDFTDIYHLASPVGSLGILSKNGYVARNIIDLIYKTVEITLRCNSRLLNVSSSEIYGHSGIHYEDDVKHIPTTSGTRTEYALGKLTSETILANLNYNHQINYNTVRPFNVVGEHQCSKIGFVWPSFFENAMQHKDIPVFYDGLQKRSFCHAKDVVKAMVCIQESDINNEVFNVGHDGNIITIIDLARKIKDRCHSQSEIIHIDPVAKYGKCYMEAFDKIPNIEKVTRLLKWRPEISLEECIERVFRFYKSKLS
jgi:nucleoside-diphosphate-sugar epimerase